MIRYTLFVITVLGSAATAIAAIAPATPSALNPANITVIEKNQAYPVYGELVFEDCSQEDCSEE
jgi:hypothetical protein